MRPTIGITTTNLKALSGIPEHLPDSWLMSQRFILATTAAGGLPWMLPLIEDDHDLRAIYDKLDGVLLPGGTDVEPALYGEPRHEACERSDLPRDRVELQLVRWALEDGKPVLGVCRGIQVMNLVTGGTLYQDLDAQLPGAVKHDYFPSQGYERDLLTHDVRIEAGSRLAEICGDGVARVNSMHHQAVKRLGDDFVVTARSVEDDVIEGIELPEHPFMVGVQWHPEALTASDPASARLFQAFVDAATSFSSRQYAVGSTR